MDRKELTTQLNHSASLAKWLNVCLQTKCLWVWILLLSLELQICCLFRVRSSLTSRQTIECRFTLKLAHEIALTYRQMHCTDKYSKHSSIIWLVWLNGWVSVYDQSGDGFESCCCNINLRYGTCFKHRVPWHSGKL